MNKQARFTAFTAATLLIFIFTLAIPIIGLAAAGDTTRVSFAVIEMQSNNDSQDAAISSDGRYVAFASFADNLMDGDANGSYDVFVRDRQTGETTRVSVSSSGGEGDDASYDPAISGDGRYVVFYSYASNLVDGDINTWQDIFLYDRQTLTTECISCVWDDGDNVVNQASYSPSISADGRYVAFESDASNLLGSGMDTNNYTDIFERDRDLGVTTRVSVSSGGCGGGNYCPEEPFTRAQMAVLLQRTFNLPLP